MPDRSRKPSRQRVAQQHRDNALARPDMVGEIRDPETAAIAVQAGLTGHLVINTIHSGVSAGAFTRLINMEIEPFMLASSLLGVIGLRLVRRNCLHCAQS